MPEQLTRDPAMAEMIDSGAMALAANAAERLLERETSTPGVTDSFRWWQSYLASRLRDLAAAVNLGQPRLFITQMVWCSDALMAKQIRIDQFREALRSLATVIDNEVDGNGHHIADHYVRAAVEELAGPTVAEKPVLDTSCQFGRLAAMYVLAILEGDRRGAMKLIRDAVADGMAIKDAYLKVLVPATHEVGRMWHQDEVSIGEEHFATATTQTVMSQLLADHDCPPLNGKTVLAATVAGDRHGLGIQVVGDFFEMDGWRVICLGPDVPRNDVAQAVIDFRADLVVLSATLHTHLRSMELTIKTLRSMTLPQPVPVLVGGNAFQADPSVYQKVGADAYATDAAGAVATGRQMMGLEEKTG